MRLVRTSDLTTAPWRRVEVLSVVLLAMAQVFLLGRTAWDKSDTADEIRYLSSGAAIWATGSYRDLCEAPVLPKLGFAAALEATSTDVSGAPSSWQDSMLFLLGEKTPEEVRWTFFSARWATILITVLAGLCLWRAASRFGPIPGVVAHALWVFSPTVLANGSLATLDGWAAALVCVVALTAVRFYERPSVGRAIPVGVACGALAATKVPALLVVPVGIGLATLFGLRRGEIRFAKSAALGRPVVLAVVAFATLWGLYGFTVGGIDLEDPCPFLPNAKGAPQGPWPFPAWLEGVLFQLRHAAEGHANYLMGETNSNGWWWFYLVAVALKTTVGVQAIVVLRLAATCVLVRRGQSTNWRLDVTLLAFPLALLFLMSAGRHQPNISFLLPAFPFAMMWVASSLPIVQRALGRRGRSLFLVLLVFAAVESLAVHPHYLMFYNLWAGGPEGGPRYLIQREDWGQDKRRLAEWQRAEGIERIYYAPYGPNADRWGIVFDQVPCESTVGVYALHAVEVHRPRFALKPGCVDWLTVEPPDERLGYSIYIYRIDQARLERLGRRIRDGEKPFWRSGVGP